MRGVLDTTLYDKVCQWLATCWWFSPGTLVSLTSKTDCHDITETLLKVALNTINQTSRQTGMTSDDGPKMMAIPHFYPLGQVKLKLGWHKLPLKREVRKVASNKLVYPASCRDNNSDLIVKCFDQCFVVTFKILETLRLFFNIKI